MLRIQLFETGFSAVLMALKFLKTALKPQALLTSWSSSQLAAKDIFDEADVFYYEIEDMD